MITKTTIETILEDKKQSYVLKLGDLVIGKTTFQADAQLYSNVINDAIEKAYNEGYDAGECDGYDGGYSDGYDKGVDDTEENG